MQVRRLGVTDLRVSALGLGCARIGGIFQGDAAGFVDLLSAAHDAGINFFDTADMYSQGESESLLGRAFAGRRDRVVIASKAGYRLPGQRRVAARLKPILRPVIRLLRLRRSALPAAVRGAPSQDFSPAYLQAAVEGSLRRLRTDYLDLFQLHSPPTDVVARGDWVDVLERMKRAGKVRYYGISVDTVEAGQAALSHPGISSLQFVISVLEPGAVEALLPRARERGVGVIARETLGNGLLVKDGRDIDLDAYCASPQEKARRTQQLAEYRSRAAAEGKTLAGLALDWVGGLDGVSVALVGARSREQLAGLLRQLPNR